MNRDVIVLGETRLSCLKKQPGMMEPGSYKGFICLNGVVQSYHSVSLSAKSEGRPSLTFCVSNLLFGPIVCPTSRRLFRRIENI